MRTFFKVPRGLLGGVGAVLISLFHLAPWSLSATLLSLWLAQAGFCGIEWACPARFDMAASLTRSTRIQSLLPLALAQGWTVRQLATSARISYASACQLLKVAAQRSETVLDADTVAVCAPLAHQLRESVTVAAEKLLARVDTLADALESAADAERLARALETLARLADNLDGLAHARSLEKERMRAGVQERPMGVSIPALNGYLPNLDACAPKR